MARDRHEIAALSAGTRFAGPDRAARGYVARSAFSVAVATGRAAHPRALSSGCATRSTAFASKPYLRLRWASVTTDTLTMGNTRQLTPLGAVAMSAVFIASGVFPILVAAGVIPRGGADAPVWVIGAAGATFVSAGLALVVGYGIAGGVGPDNDLLPGGPTGVRVANLILGLTTVGLMTVIAGWIAFGPGPRHFTTTLIVAFLPVSRRWGSDEWTGRVAFGTGSVLMAVMFVAYAVAGVRRIAQSRRGRS